MINNAFDVITDIQNAAREWAQFVNEQRVQLQERDEHIAALLRRNEHLQVERDAIDLECARLTRKVAELESVK